MKIKKTLAILLAALSIASVSSLSASAANTVDSHYTYTWSGNQRYDYTPARQKADSSPVYICAINNSLPASGFYAGTYYNNSESLSKKRASKGEYLVNDYAGHTIKSNAVSFSLKGKYVRIRGHYSNTNYSWGDCTIAWSPDTYNASGYSSLN